MKEVVFFALIRDTWQVMEEKLDNKNVELASVRSSDAKFKIYSTAELEAVIERL